MSASDCAIFSPKISLTTSCMNRSYQLRRVFTGNLRTVLSCSAVEWVIVDYGSDEALLEELSEFSDLGMAQSQVKVFTAV